MYFTYKQIYTRILYKFNFDLNRYIYILLIYKALASYGKQFDTNNKQKEKIMTKCHDAKKCTKKAPKKSLKEKRVTKKAKKATKSTK